MITDGEPTAHILPGGEPFFSYPPAPETLRATLAEVARCTADDIRINTFMLDATPDLQAFVERWPSINRGRVFFTTPENLGSYVLVDFLEQKRACGGGRVAGTSRQRAPRPDSLRTLIVNDGDPARACEPDPP